MIKVEFGYGVGRDRNRKPIRLYDLLVAQESIRKTAARLFGGYAIYLTEGGWTDPSGTLVEEQGRTLMIQMPSLNRLLINEMREAIGNELNQEEVIVTYHEVSEIQPP